MIQAAPIKKNLLNIFGKSTKRKIVIFEVDDYGASHYYDKNSLNEIDKIDQGKLSFFTKFDRVASTKDLSDLFEVLTSVKDKNGNPAVFTPLTIVGNPDFEKIRENNCEHYDYESFTETITRIEGKDVWNLWKEGIESKIFVPEFHGREHFNVQMLMNAVQTPGSFANRLFQKGIIASEVGNSRYKKFTSTYQVNTSQELKNNSKSLKEGIKLFEELLGYRPTLFTPPAGGFSYEYGEVLKENGIRRVTLSYKHRVQGKDGSLRSSYNYFGKKRNGIIVAPRNCQFEPHSAVKKDWVNSCMKDISIAFKWNKPALISSHRINFVNQNSWNNGAGLVQLRRLLEEMIMEWPDVEFIESSKLLV